MKVLVTGASGFLGSYVLDSLSRRGIPAVAVSRRPAHDANVDTIPLDLLTEADPLPLLARTEATHLLHLAWYTEHGKYWSSPLNLRWVDASLRLIEAFCATGGRRVVVAGTCAEYDWSYGWCREDDTPLAPASLYGIAKDALQRLATAACALHGVPCAWGRVFFPYGEGESAQRLLPGLASVFRGERPPFAVNAAAYRDFVHASDVAEAFVALLLTDTSGAFNISSGMPTRIEDLVRETARILDADPRKVLGLAAQPSGEPPLVVGDNRRLLSLDWRPSLTLAEGIAHTIRPAQPAEPHRRARV